MKTKKKYSNFQKADYFWSKSKKLADRNKENTPLFKYYWKKYLFYSRG